jgi:DNA-binding CsgD family transcriptional regulator
MSDDQTSVRPVVFSRKRSETAAPALTVTGGQSIGKVYVLREPEYLIGRDEAAAISLRDHGVSRKHAKVVLASDGIVNLLDLRSTNGTYVNGARIDLTILRDGDSVQIGPEAALRFGYLEVAAGAPASGPQLTPRQVGVARLVAAGLTNAEIARRLGISERTVTTHLDHIYERLQIGSRAALARHVAEHGLLGADEPDAP